MHPRRLFVQLLIPSGAELFLGAVAASAILILSNITSLAALLGTPDSHFTFNGVVGSYTQAALGQFGQSATLARLTNFLLWAGAGALAYLAVWLVFDSYTMIRNDVVIGTTYTSTYRNTRVRYWAELTVRSVVRVCAVLLILSLTTVVVQIWYPLSILMFGMWVSNFTVGLHWLYMLEAFAGWIAVLHLGTVFLRLSLLRTRVFGSTAEYEE